MDLKSQGNNVNNLPPGFELRGVIKPSSYGSRPCLQKLRARLTGCAIDIWTGRCPTGISFQVLVFSCHSLYLTAVTGVWKRKRDPKGQRPLPSTVLRSGSIGSMITRPLAWAFGQNIPAVLKLGWTWLAGRCLAQGFCSGRAGTCCSWEIQGQYSQIILGGILARITSWINSG